MPSRHLAYILMPSRHLVCTKVLICPLGMLLIYESIRYQCHSIMPSRHLLYILMPSRHLVHLNALYAFGVYYWVLICPLGILLIYESLSFQCHAIMPSRHLGYILMPSRHLVASQYLLSIWCVLLSADMPSRHLTHLWVYTLSVSLYNAL